MNEHPEESLPPDNALAASPTATRQGASLETILVDDRRRGPGTTPIRRRRRWLPIFLFLVTCLTTFAAGCYSWNPTVLGFPAEIRLEAGDKIVDAQGNEVVLKSKRVLYISPITLLQKNWRSGLIYMVSVMGILLFHEMGHFLLTIRYKVPASFPFFIPVPFMITGTMGAVIGMDPYKANRKEVFDIGLAGPLAGLVLTIPLVIYGIMIAEPTPVDPTKGGFGDPLLVTMLIPVLHDIDQVREKYARDYNDPSALKKEFTFLVNPIYMAGWVGMLVTGLNMLPLSQLDGGHVSYAVLGRYSRWVGRCFLIAAIAFIVLTDSYNWSLMLILVIMIGTDHPPTADDTVKLGPLRWTIGLLSLSIPIFCFTPFPLIMGQ